jgi:hypothetical protein
VLRRDQARDLPELRSHFGQVLGSDRRKLLLECLGEGEEALVDVTACVLHHERGQRWNFTLATRLNPPTVPLDCRQQRPDVGPK